MESPNVEEKTKASSYNLHFQNKYLDMQMSLQLKDNSSTFDSICSTNLTISLFCQVFTFCTYYLFAIIILFFSFLLRILPNSIFAL